MAAIRYCPSCEGIVAAGDERCVLCGADLGVHVPLAESPAVARDDARRAEEQAEAKPSGLLGVLAWFAQLTAGAMIALFCVLPAIAVVVGGVLVLLGR